MSREVSLKVDPKILFKRDLSKGVLSFKKSSIRLIRLSIWPPVLSCPLILTAIQPTLVNTGLTKILIAPLIIKW